MEAGGVLRLLKGSPLTDPTTAPGPRHTVFHVWENVTPSDTSMVMDVSNDPVPPSLPAGLDLKVPLPDGFGAAALQSLPLWFRNVDASCFLVALPGALFCSPGLVTFATGPDPVHAELQLARTAVRGFLHVLNLAIEGDASAPACMDEYREFLRQALEHRTGQLLRQAGESTAALALWPGYDGDETLRQLSPIALTYLDTEWCSGVDCKFHQAETRKLTANFLPCPLGELATANMLSNMLSSEPFQCTARCSNCKKPLQARLTVGAVAGTVVLSVPHFFPEGKRGANRVRDFIAGNKALRIKVFAGGNEASLVDGAVATTRRFALTGIVLGNGGHFIAAVPTGSGVRILDDLEASVSTLTLEEALAAYDKYYPSLLVYSETKAALPESPPLHGPALPPILEEPASVPGAVASQPVMAGQAAAALPQQRDSVVRGGHMVRNTDARRKRDRAPSRDPSPPSLRPRKKAK